MLQLRHYEQISIENRRFHSNGVSMAQNFRWKELPHQPLSCHKSGINVLSCGIRMLAQVSFVLSQSTRLTDRSTDGQTFHSWPRPPCIQRSAVKTLLQQTRNSSGDEIANVNFLYDDIAHVIQNTIDLCINSATADRRGYVLERMCLPNSVK